MNGTEDKRCEFREKQASRESQPALTEKEKCELIMEGWVEFD